MKINYKVLIFCFLIVFLTAFIGSRFTTPNTNTEWYNSTKTAITPPNYIFPIVWNILFALIAISLYLAWINAKQNQKNKLAIIFTINLALNILWSIIFFSLKNPVLSFLELIILWLSILIMLTTTYKINRLSFYLLIPYLIWVTFAGILNFLIAF